MTTMRKVRKVMRAARHTSKYPTWGGSMKFEQYVKDFDSLNWLKPVTYTFGEKK